MRQPGFRSMAETSVDFSDPNAMRYDAILVDTRVMDQLRLLWTEFVGGVNGFLATCGPREKDEEEQANKFCNLEKQLIRNYTTTCVQIFVSHDRVALLVATSEQASKHIRTCASALFHHMAQCFSKRTYHGNQARRPRTRNNGGACCERTCRCRKD